MTRASDERQRRFDRADLRYLDHKSALDWIQLCNTPQLRRHLPRWVSIGSPPRRSREVFGPVGVDVIALGPGDGKTEVRLVQRLIAEYEEPNVRFYLLDISQPLLNEHSSTPSTPSSMNRACSSAGYKGTFIICHGMPSSITRPRAHIGDGYTRC